MCGWVGMCVWGVGVCVYVGVLMGVGVGGWVGGWVTMGVCVHKRVPFVPLKVIVS